MKQFLKFESLPTPKIQLKVGKPVQNYGLCKNCDSRLSKKDYKGICNSCWTQIELKGYGVKSDNRGDNTVWGGVNEF